MSYAYPFILYGIGLALLACDLEARDYPPSTDPDQPILFDQPDEDIIHLKNRLDDPLDINRAGLSEWMDLPGMDFAYIEDILAWQKINGNFSSLEHFRSLQLIPETLYYSIEAYITVRHELHTADAGSSYRKKNNRWQLRQIQRRSVEAPKPSAKNDDLGLQNEMYWRLHEFAYEINAAISYRTSMQSRFDPSTGYLATNRTNSNDAYLDEINISSVQPSATRWIAGHYQIGFGNRLILDNTGRQRPDSWTTPPPAVLDHEQGKIRPSKRFFGGAISRDFQFKKFGLNASTFFSRQLLDLYQYDLRYGPDPLTNLPTCERPGQTAQGFTCDVYGRWGSSFIVDQKKATAQDFTDELPGVSYATIRDAFRETLAGLNMSAKIADQQFGYTQYVADVDFQLNAPDIRFSDYALYPDREKLNVFGLYHQFASKQGLIIQEIARSQQSGFAYLGQWQSNGKTDSLKLIWRYYNKNYVSPHGHGAAAADQTFGNAQRNEEGIKTVWNKYNTRWHARTTIDIWQQRYITAPGNRLTRLDSPIADAYFQQQFEYRFSPRQQWGGQLEVKNNYLSANGREQSYQSGDAQGAGERYKTQLDYRWSPPKWQYQIKWQSIWEDVARYSNRFDTEQILYMSLRYDLSHANSISLRGSRWYHTIPYTGNYAHDRERPKYSGLTQWNIEFTKSVQWSMGIGYLRFLDNRPDFNNRYWSARSSLSVKF